MGCVQAKPLDLEGSSDYHYHRGLDRLKMDNGYVSSADFVPHRRSTGGQRPQLDDHDHLVLQREVVDVEQPRKHKGVVETAGVGNIINAAEIRRKGLSVGKKRDGHDDKKKPLNLNKCFEDDMVDGWPRWFVDNVPTQALAGLVPKSAESYKMIDKVFP